MSSLLSLPYILQFTHGEDDRLKTYLRTNSISPNVLTDESDVIMLKGPKVLEFAGGVEADAVEEQPTWMSFDDDDF